MCWTNCLKYHTVKNRKQRTPCGFPQGVTFSKTGDAFSIRASQRLSHFDSQYPCFFKKSCGVIAGILEFEKSLIFRVII